MENYPLGFTQHLLEASRIIYWGIIKHGITKIKALALHDGGQGLCYCFNGRLCAGALYKIRQSCFINHPDQVACIVGHSNDSVASLTNEVIYLYEGIF